MKRFSVILLILIAISMVFVSCNSEAASNSSDVAKVAVGLGSSKALSASYVAESLPSADELVWKYTANKNDNGFRTGVTSEQTAIRTDNEGKGLPSVIGQNGTDGSGTWFSTGNWLFSFYGYKDSVLVYEATDVAVTVDPATQNNNIGGTANITLSIHTDPRSDCKVMMSPITVDFGNGFDSNATYILKVADNGSDVVTNLGGVANNNEVTFSRESALISYNANQLGSIHLLTFTVTKNNDTNNTVYASGEIAIWARKGYTWTISGNLSSLESVAQVGVNTVVVPTDTAQPTTTISIGNEAELKAFAAYVNQGNTCEGLTIELTHDITLTSAWTPIGNDWRGDATSENAKVFKGTFDGKDKTISGLTVAESTYSAAKTDNAGYYCYGLFGVVDSATIKNLKLGSVNISLPTKGDSVGAVVGYAVHGVTINNCSVLGGTISGRDAVGGIIGRAYGVDGTDREFTITGCSNAANVTANDSSLDSGSEGKAAGIGGFLSPTGKGAESGSLTVSGCSNSGTITSSTSRSAGIVVYGFKTGKMHAITISNNTNEGSINTGNAICYNASPDNAASGSTLTISGNTPANQNI